MDATYPNISCTSLTVLFRYLNILPEIHLIFHKISCIGLHPEDLKGTRTGVVVGVASSETQDKWSQMPDRINGYEYIGCTRTMFANRVSYYLDIKGLYKNLIFERRI